MLAGWCWAYDRGIAARLLTRIAIFVASLAWGALVFSHTVGNPDRAADVAAAVLADDEARAQVVAPVTAAVMRSTGLPVDQQSFVATEVDRILRDPDGARTFIDPFVGSWSSALGLDDARSTQFDVGRLVAVSPALSSIGPISDLPLSEVGASDGIPLLDGGYGWVGRLGRLASAATIPLAILAIVLAVSALAIGERRSTLRRLGSWAIAAGGIWVVLPPVVVWAARRWASRADAVVEVAVGEAMSGLIFPALALVLGGAGLLTISFAIAPTSDHRRRSAERPVRPNPPPVIDRPRDEERRYAGALAARAAEASTTRLLPEVAHPAEAPGSPPEHDPGDESDDDLWTYYGQR